MAYLVGIAVLVLLAVPTTGLVHGRGASIVFLNRGIVSFTKPSYGQLGTRSSGMYGAFAEFPAVFGFRPMVMSELPPNLDDIDVLVLTNLDQGLASSEKQRIWDYVAKGGRLWILGDHTFVKNGKNWINDMLSPFAIKLNHDSAQFFVQGWFDSYEIRAVPPFSMLRNDAENSLGMLVGASLDVRSPAEPILVGRYGFSDRGTEIRRPNVEYMGDLKFQRSERLGDLVLVAGQRLGKGKVVVFGDTSSFFNNNISRSYTLARAALTYLHGKPRFLYVRPAAAILFSCLLVALLFRYRSVIAERIPLALALIGVVTWCAERSASLVPFDEEVTRNRLAVVDASHCSDSSKHGVTDDSTLGLSVNLLRCSRLPVACNEWDRELLDNAGLLFLVAPQKQIVRSKVRDIHRFMEEGGTVVVACGREHSGACKRLLNSVGMGIGDVPLGRLFDKRALGSPVSFFSAWAVESDRHNAKVIASYDEKWPLIVSRSCGRGRFVLIGDSFFFHNKNFEGFTGCDKNNIVFFRRLLQSDGDAPQ
jgi:hypothetical protein